MSKTLRFITFLSILCLSTGVLAFKVSTQAENSHDVANYTKLTGMTDISVYLENTSVRARSTSSISEIFNTDPFAQDTSFSAIIYKRTER